MARLGHTAPRKSRRIRHRRTPLAAIRAANAALPHKQSRPGIIQPSIAGSAWSIPAVLAGLPLAARSRARTKLAPSQSTLSAPGRLALVTKSFPRLCQARTSPKRLYPRGGSVSLFLHYIGFLRAGPVDGIRGPSSACAPLQPTSRSFPSDAVSQPSVPSVALSLQPFPTAVVTLSLFRKQ